MRKKITKTILFTLTVALSGLIAGAQSDKAPTRVEDAIWAGGEIYSTVVVKNGFNTPPEHSVDILYNFGMSGLMGQRAISDAAPGDEDYNGGRWSVYLVTFTESGLLVHDPDDDGWVDFELTSAEQVFHHVALGHIQVVAAGVYFSCPLVKSGR